MSCASDADERREHRDAHESCKRQPAQRPRPSFPHDTWCAWRHCSGRGGRVVPGWCRGDVSRERHGVCSGSRRYVALAPLSRAERFGAQLTAQLHHGAKVLDRGREAQLRHQFTASGERFETKSSAERERRGGHRHGDDDGDQVDPTLADPPQREATGEIARPDPCQPVGAVVPDTPRHGRLPGDHDRGDDRRGPAWNSERVAQDSGRDERRTDDRTECAARERPTRHVILRPRWRSADPARRP